MLALFTKIPLSGCYKAMATKCSQGDSRPRDPSCPWLCGGMSLARAAGGGELRSIVTERREEENPTDVVRGNFTS